MPQENGCGCMPQESAPADPGRDEDPARRAVGMPTGPDQPLPPGNPVEADWEPVITRPGRLTPGGLRAAIARAVMDVAPRRPGSGGRKRPGTPGWSSGPRTPGTLR